MIMCYNIIKHIRVIKGDCEFAGSFIFLRKTTVVKFRHGGQEEIGRCTNPLRPTSHFIVFVIIFANSLPCLPCLPFVALSSPLF